MKKLLSGLIKNITSSINRFFSTFCLTVCLFLVNAYRIIFEPSRGHEDIINRLTLVFSLGILLCTLGTILYEKLQNKIRIKKVFFDIGLVILSGLTYFAFADFGDDVYVTNGYFGIITALFLCLVYFSIKDSISRTFSYIFKNSVFNFFVCGIIMAGISLCIFAFNSLIFRFDDVWKIYTVTALFVWIILFLNLCLSAIPGKETVFVIPKAFKTIVMYAALPTYLLLISILYIYLARILITLDFPSGQINWFASFASLMFIFFILALEQYRKESNLANLFVKFAGFMIIPIIAMQFWAIHIRLSAHGLTTMRYISIVLNAIALLFAIVSLVKGGRWVKDILPVIAVTALVITITPLNVIDVPVRNQTTKLLSLLKANNMIVDGQITANENVSVEDRVMITSAFNYINTSRGNRPDILVGVENRLFLQTFGFQQTTERGYIRQNLWGTFRYAYDGIDVEAYSRFYRLSQSGGSFNIESVGISYDITKYIEELYELHGLEYEGRIEIPIGDNKLILTHVSFRIREGEALRVMSFSGYLLVRDN